MEAHGLSLVAAHGLSSSRAQLLQHFAGLVAPSHVASYFPNQGSNLHPLHWKVDSQPLGHQGSPSNHRLLNVVAPLDSAADGGQAPFPSTHISRVLGSVPSGLQR